MYFRALKSLFGVLLLVLAGCCTSFQPGNKTEGYSWPVSGTVFQGFYGNEISGEWPGFYFNEEDEEKFFTGSGRMHRGVDIMAPVGTAVVAALGGVASRYDWDGKAAYGNRVVIDHGGDYWTLYAHLSKITVQNGAFVKEGEKIGEVGSTGNSTGPHLHFEIRHSPDPDYLRAPHFIPGKRGDFVVRGDPIPYVYPKSR